MNTIWNLNLETTNVYFDILAEVEKRYERELTGEEKEMIFLQLMKELNIKSSGHTELNRNELIGEIVSKGKKILSIDEEGYKFIEKKEDND